MFQTIIFGILCNGCQLKCMSAFMGTIYLFIKNHYLFVTIIIQINVMCIILFFFFFVKLNAVSFFFFSDFQQMFSIVIHFGKCILLEGFLIEFILGVELTNTTVMNWL